jgi:nitrite reductase/ring-hydroxylating ferredoxin subunit
MLRLATFLLSDYGFIKTIRKEDLLPNHMRTVEIGGEGVLLANVEGKIYAMGAYCTHEFWDLSEGELNGTSLRCAGHGSVWDITKGTAEFVELLENLPLYDVTTKDDGYLYVRKRSDQD